MLTIMLKFFKFVSIELSVCSKFMNLYCNLEKLRRVISKYLWGIHWETGTLNLNDSVSRQELKSAQKIHKSIINEVRIFRWLQISWICIFSSKHQKISTCLNYPHTLKSWNIKESISNIFRKVISKYYNKILYFESITIKAVWESDFWNISDSCKTNWFSFLCNGQD